MVFFGALIARVAELVDALVSNTNDSNIVPVRSRPRVQKPPQNSCLEGAFSIIIRPHSISEEKRSRLGPAKEALT